MNDTGARVPNGFDSFGPWFTEAFELLKAQWQTWVLISLICVAVGFGAGLLIAGPGVLIVNGVPMLGFLIPPLQGVVGLVAAALLLPGMIRTGIKQIRGEAIAPGDIFSATDVFVGAAVVIIATAAGFIACGIGVLVTSTLFFFALPLLVDKRVSFGDALSKSMEVTKQNFWFFLVYMIVIRMVAGLGSVACGIGILVTMPMAVLGMVVAYERTFNAPAAAVAPEALPEPPAPPVE